MTDSRLTSRDFTQSNAPFTLFQEWLDEVSGSEVNDPNAFSLATIDDQNMPNVRILLLKGFDEDGFVFYTNFESAKGQELLNHMKAAMCFHWKTKRRQVRIRGNISVVSDQEADEYYNSRPEGSRIGAWASQQSRPLEAREVLENAVSEMTEKFKDQEIPRPKHWSGFRLTPLSIEFWQDREFRLHDRIVFQRASENDDWDKTRLYP